MAAFDNNEDRNAALRKWARNDRHCTAAVELPIAHDCWLGRLDEAGLVTRFAPPEDDYARPVMQLTEVPDDPHD